MQRFDVTVWIVGVPPAGFCRDSRRNCFREESTIGKWNSARGRSSLHQYYTVRLLPSKPVKPEPGDTIGCVNCQIDFELPYPATDVMYVPACPKCGTVVNGYEKMDSCRKRNSEALDACATIEQELEEILDKTRSTRDQVPEGTAIEALRETAEDLCSISQWAADKTEEIVDGDR